MMEMKKDIAQILQTSSESWRKKLMTVMTEDWAEKFVIRYSTTLKEFSNNEKEFQALLEDVEWNLDHLGELLVTRPGKNTYGCCDVCYKPLSDDSWHHCLQCNNNYDECNDCYAKKLKDNKPHPHYQSMIPTLWDLFKGFETPQTNILSFDGGGIRGYTSILMFEKYVRELYKNQNSEDPDTTELDAFTKEIVSKKFSLICGTSIGGIIAIMFALEIPLSAIKFMFEDKNLNIFVKEWFYKLGSSKYQDTGLRHAYNTIVAKYIKNKRPGDLTFEDLPLPCAVSSFDIRTNKILWFSTKTSNNMMPNIDSKKIKIIDAVLSTSAAPTYFPIHSFNVGNVQYDCVDGGMWCNDPRLFAYFYEKSFHLLEYDHRYNIISFGTGEVKQAPPKSFYKNHWDSTVAWLTGQPNIIDVMFEGSTAMTDLIFMAVIPATALVRVCKVQLLLTTPVRLDDANSLKLQRELVEQDKNIKDSINHAVRISLMMGLKHDDD